MPLLVHAVAAWLMGLYAATLHPTPAAPLLAYSVAAAAVAALSCATLLSARGQRFALCTAVAVAAFVVGSTAAEHRASCTSALAGGAPLVVALDARAYAGAFVRGEARGVEAQRDCHVVATLKVTAGSAPAGSVVAFDGQRSAVGRGLRLEGEVRLGPQRSVLRAWRARAGDAIDTLFGSRAPLARALLIADQDGIDPAVRDRFADAGLIHILSISGLHVALIAGALTVVAAALRLPHGVAAAASLAVVTLYVLALGAPAPAVRSAVMLATSTLVARVQRPVHPWTALALGAVIPTWQPDVVIDLGWQLSVSGMASLVGARALMRRVRNATPGPLGTHRFRLMRHGARVRRDALRAFQQLDGWRWTVARELVTGVIASLVTAPIVTWYFGRLSLVAPVANILAGPVIAFLQPALFLALVLAPWPVAAKLAADACTVPLVLLDRIAMQASRIPHAAVHVAPTLLTAVCLGLVMASFVGATASRRPARALTVGALALCVAAWAPLAGSGSGRLELHVIDVGQGDALAIRTPRGHWILVDAGRSWNGGDAGRRSVVPYLRRLGGDVVAFVLTHPHDDHVGGALSVVQALAPQSWWEPAYVGTTPMYRRALVAIQHDGIAWHRAHPGDTLRVDGVLIRALAPDSAWTSVQRDPNLASVVLAVEYGHVRWLLTGDAEAEEEGWLVRRWGDGLAASVLKVGHHGSKTSSTAEFLDRVQPAVALVSVGRDNSYGLPSPSVMQEFRRRGIRVLRTDEQGTIVVRTDGVTQEVVTADDRFTVRVP